MGCISLCFGNTTKSRSLYPKENEKNPIPIEEIQSAHAIPIKHHCNEVFSPENKVRLRDFKLHKVLGKGGFGKVLLVEKIDSGQIYAMKILNKSFLKKKNQQKNTETERLILSKIIHPFIIQLFFAFQTPENLYLVTEFAQGGFIYDREMETDSNLKGSFIFI